MAVTESKRDENVSNKLSDVENNRTQKQLNGPIAASENARAFMDAYRNVMNMLEDSGFMTRRNVERDQPVYEQTPAYVYEPRSTIDNDALLERFPNWSRMEQSIIDKWSKQNMRKNDWNDIKKTYSRFGPDSAYEIDPKTGLSYKDFLDWKYDGTDDLNYEAQRDYLEPYVMSGEFNPRDRDFQQFLNSSDVDRRTYWDIVLDYVDDYLSKNKQYGTR